MLKGIITKTVSFISSGVPWLVHPHVEKFSQFAQTL